MKARLAILITCTLIAAGLSRAGDPGKEQKSLQGTWVFSKDDKKGQLTFAGNKFTFMMDDETFKGTFKIHPGKKPKGIDMTVQEGKKYEGKTSLGIYKLEGDKLTWCANEPGREERPTEFSGGTGDKKMLLVVMDRKKK